MRVGRYIVDEKKNKAVKEDLCGQSPSSMQGGEHRSENRRYALSVQQQGNLEARSHVRHPSLE